MKSYLFYDLETTGLSKSFDQILQFAAIRTDVNLKEINRYSVTVKLRPDVIPSPYACITHRISLGDMACGMTELDAARHIHALLNTPGTVSLGYNTLGFDDEFLRFTFYRNLLSPYHHQYANGCGRMDILPMAVLYFLYKPLVIKWPEAEGRPSLKLEQISGLNGLAVGRAHDAMVDVEATVELARRFAGEKEMWDFVTGYFNKESDRERIAKLPSEFESSAGMHLKGLMTASKFGPDRLYQSPVLYIGDSIPYKNQTLWLRLDQVELRDTGEDNVMEKTYVVRKRYGEPDIILPPLDRFMGKLNGDRLKLAEENIDFLKKEKNLFYKIVKANREFRYPDVDNVDLDAALYLSGFHSKEEDRLCGLFHRTVHERGLASVDLFDDGNLKKQAKRILFRNMPTACPGDCGTDFADYLKAVNPMDESGALKDYRDERKLTPRKAMEQIEDLRNTGGLDKEQEGILAGLEQYIKDTFMP
jgi:exodeoxyribonuclease-1